MPGIEISRVARRAHCPLTWRAFDLFDGPHHVVAGWPAVVPGLIIHGPANPGPFHVILADLDV